MWWRRRSKRGDSSPSPACGGGRGRGLLTRQFAQTCGVAPPLPPPQPSPASGGGSESLRPGMMDFNQYVARPPDMSNTAPVVKEHSCEAQKATRLAISSTSTKRPRGIFESM